MRHPSKVADTDEASWQDVQQETADELMRGQCHLTLLAVVGVILPAESDLVLLEAQQPVIGDRHPMGIPRQVMQHMLGTAEGPFGIHHPILAKQGSQELGEYSWLAQRVQRSVELQSPTPVEAFE
jgi:hypothetical protein